MAPSPFDLIKSGASRIIQGGKSALGNFANAKDNSTAGVVRNTITGLPSAAKDMAFYKTPFDNEIKNPKINLTNKKGQSFQVPDFTGRQLSNLSTRDKVVGVSKLALQTYVDIGKIGSKIISFNNPTIGLPRIQQPVSEQIVKTKIGQSLSRVFPRLEEMAVPKTKEEALAFKSADVASFLPMGSLKSTRVAANFISKTDDVAKIYKELKQTGIEDPTELSKLFASSKDEQAIHRKIEDTITTQSSKKQFTGKQAVKDEATQGKIAVLDDIIANTEETLASHVGAKLKSFQSKKEGEFLSMKNPSFAKNETERIAIIARNQKIADVGANAGLDLDNNPDGVIESIEQYNKLKERLSQLKTQRADLKTIKPVPEAVTKAQDPPVKKPKEGELSFSEEGRIFQEELDTPSNYVVQKAEVRSSLSKLGVPKQAQNLNDIGNISKGYKDISRNFEQVFKESYPGMKKALLDPLDDSKGRFIDMQKNYAKSLSDNVVKGLKINRGSKESSAIMQFGEKRRDYDSLVKEFGAKRADDIVKADEWFRKEYDNLLDQVNSVRTQIYPNNPDKIIPKRKDYYRHFQEMNGDLSGLRNLFETPTGIDPKLSGISPFTEPKEKFLPFGQKRIGNKTTDDAVGGFLDYIPHAAYAIHINPSIGKFWALADVLAESTSKSKNLNNFIDYLRKYAGSLAGKTNDIDRALMDFVPGGRKTLRVSDAVNRRVKANVILANAGSSLAQIANVPQGIASARQYAVKGLSRTLVSVLKENVPMGKSTFLKERYFKDMQQFDTGMLQNTKKFAIWMTGVLDEVGTKFIWNSHYEKALAKGIDDPIRYADNITRSLVAGRGIGEVPLIQQSKTMQLVAPFQLEVANLWHVMKDMVSKKDFTGMVILFVSSYVMNRTIAEIRGSDVSFDPINAVIDAYRIAEEEEKVSGKITKFGGRLAGEVLSNLPLGQTIAGAIYPKEGFQSIAGLPIKTPTRRDFFGEGDPTRFGSGLLTTNALKDAQYKLLPPFGGVQIKKSIEAIKAMKEGGSFDKGGNLQFLTPGGIGSNIKSIIFGKYANKNAKEYFDRQKTASTEEASIKPLYNKIEQLKQEGKKEEALAIAESMSEKDYEVYRKIVKKEKSQKTLEDKKAVLPKYLEIEKLKQEGKKEEAMAIAESMSEDEYRAYDLVKKQLKEDKKAANGEEPKFDSENTYTERSIINTVKIYGTALGLDPVTAFNRIFTGQSIKYVSNGAIVVERLSLSKSQEIKENLIRESGESMADVKLDHFIPLQLEGSNSEDNLKIVPNEVWSSYTPVENAIGKALRDKKINKKTAKDLITKFKNGDLTKDEVLKNLN